MRGCLDVLSLWVCLWETALIMLIGVGIWKLDVGSSTIAWDRIPELSVFRSPQGIRKHARICSSLSADRVSIATSRSCLDFLEARGHYMEL